MPTLVTLKELENEFNFLAPVEVSDDYNAHIPNIDAISGALITLSLSILILNFQCEEGVKDDIDIWYMGILKFRFLYFDIYLDTIPQAKC